MMNKLFDLFIITIEPIRPGREYPRKYSVQKEVSTHVIKRFVKSMTLTINYSEVRSQNSEWKQSGFLF